GRRVPDAGRAGLARPPQSRAAAAAARRRAADRVRPGHDRRRVRGRRPAVARAVDGRRGLAHDQVPAFRGRTRLMITPREIDYPFRSGADKRPRWRRFAVSLLWMAFPLAALFSDG